MFPYIGAAARTAAVFSDFSSDGFKMDSDFGRYDFKVARDFASKSVTSCPFFLIESERDVKWKEPSLDISIVTWDFMHVIAQTFLVVN